METIDVHMNWQVRFVHNLLAKRLGSYEKNLQKVPKWLRGLSAVQLDAANSLANALRDDMEQKTISNVAKVLEKLGLHPKPLKYNIQMLIHMSRGNDMAFLWFLMEACYKTQYHGMSYNANEQIIMTCIYQLDVYPVIREMDKILPLPKDPSNTLDMLVRDVEKERKLVNKVLDEDQCETKVKKRSRPATGEKTWKSPYFEEQFLPKMTKRRLTAKYPAQPAYFRAPPHETTLFMRWFGEFSALENRILINSVLNKEINRIIHSFQTAKVSDEDLRSMCDHHKRITEMEESLKNHLEAVKLMRCKEFTDVTTRQQEKRRKRIIEDLEERSNKYLAQFREMATKMRIMTIRNQLSLSSKSQAAVAKQPLAFIRHSVSGFGEGDVVDGAMQKTKKAKSSGVIDMLAHGQERSNCGFCSSNKDMNSKGKHHHLAQSLSVDHFLRTSVHDWKESPKNEENVFEVSDMGGTPNCKFNYRELFRNDSEKWLDNEKQRLKEAFIAAIDSDVAILNAAMDNNKTCDSIDDAVSRTVKKMFKGDLDIYEHEYQRLVLKKAAKKKKERLDFGTDNFDPDNEKQMREILRIALQRVGKDKRYVLPTLPDAEYIPLLMEWICFRYGKKYSQKERQQIFKQNNMVMQALILMLKSNMVEPPRTTFPGSRMVSYEHQKCLRRMAKRMHTRYRALFCQSILEVSRIFYYVMRPHLCTNIPLSTFYAYMPSHYYDAGFSSAIKTAAVSHWLVKRCRLQFASQTRSVLKSNV